MKISKVRIKNFRGIKDLELSDLTNLTVITGATGSGKSSVLYAIGILLSWLIARIRHPKGQGLKIQDKDITLGETYCQLEIELDNGVKWSIGKRLSNEGKNSDAKTNIAQMTLLANSLVEKEDFPLIAGYSANRIVDETPINVLKNSELNPENSLRIELSGIVNFHNFFRTFRELEDLENEKMRMIGHLVPNKELNAVRQSLSGFFGQFSDLKVHRELEIFTINKEGKVFDFLQLSQCEKSYITLVLDLALRLALAHPSEEEPLSSEGIILIDEIDYYLHPICKANFVETIQQKFPNCQFFFTTSSTEVTSCIESYSGDNLFSL